MMSHPERTPTVERRMASEPFACSSVPAGGQFGAKKNPERNRCMCMYATKRYRQIQIYMHTFECVYVHVCKFKIQAHTCRYAHQQWCICACMQVQNTATYMQICTSNVVHMCMYVGSKYQHIHADMHPKKRCICVCMQVQNTS